MMNGDNGYKNMLVEQVEKSGLLSYGGLFILSIIFCEIH